MPKKDVIRSPDSTLMSTPYWRRPSERYPGALPEHAEVLVIGGGITGVSLLHHLRARGMEGVLVERAYIASGASGRNAGFLLAGVADSYADAVRTYGRSRASDIWHMTLENHATMTEAVKGEDVGHRRLGSAILASGEEEAARLAESAQLPGEAGFEARWNGRRLVNPRDGEVKPATTFGALGRHHGVHGNGAAAGGSGRRPARRLPMRGFQRPRHGFRLRQREEVGRVAVGAGSERRRNAIQFSPMTPSTWAALKCLRSIPRSCFNSFRSAMGPYLESMPQSRSVPRPTCSGPPVERAW